MSSFSSGSSFGNDSGLIFEYEGATSLGDAFRGSSSSSLSRLEGRLCSCVVSNEPFDSGYGGGFSSDLFDSNESEDEG